MTHTSVYGAIAGITKKPKPKGRAPFIHVFGNLYVVPTPLLTGLSKTAIEDFFDNSTLETIVDSRSFSRESKPDSTFYGKAIFAHKVVAKNSHTIDFRNFKSLLDRIVGVIDDYDAKLQVN